MKEFWSRPQVWKQAQTKPQYLFLQRVILHSGISVYLQSSKESGQTITREWFPSHSIQNKLRPEFHLQTGMMRSKQDQIPVRKKRKTCQRLQWSLQHPFKLFLFPHYKSSNSCPSYSGQQLWSLFFFFSSKRLTMSLFF